MATLLAFLQLLGRTLGVLPPSPRIVDLLDSWCADRIADGMQPRGVARYREQLVAFIAWASEDTTISDFRAPLIRDYKRYLGNRPTGRPRRGDPPDTLVCAGTTRNALSALRSFGDWC